MRRSTLEEFARDPVGRFVAGKSFAHFCVDAGLWGVVLWDRVDTGDAIEAGRSFILEIRPPALPHSSIVDASRLQGSEAGAFAALEGYVRRYSELLARHVERLALVRPPGPVEGAMVAGAYEVVGRPYPVAIFDRLPAALAWLDRQRSLGIAPERLIDEMNAIHTEVTGTPHLVGRLRALLETRLATADIGEVASALALSERTLQRRLHEAGTSFQGELGAARVRAAQRILAAGDAAVTTVALEVGCASLQHFNALFRRIVGESPTAWRDRHRRRVTG